jgi:hypothetical protein
LATQCVPYTKLAKKSHTKQGKKVGSKDFVAWMFDFLNPTIFLPSWLIPATVLSFRTVMVGFVGVS